MALEFDEQLSRLEKPSRDEMTNKEYAVFNENVLNCRGVGCGAAWHAGGDVCVGEELSAHSRSFQYGFSGSGRRFVICSLGYDGEPLA